MKKFLKILIVIYFFSFLPVYPAEFSLHNKANKAAPTLTRKESFYLGNQYMLEAKKHTIKTPPMPKTSRNSTFFPKRPEGIARFIAATNLSTKLSEQKVTASNLKQEAIFALNECSPRNATIAYNNLRTLQSKQKLIAQELVQLRNKNKKI